MEQLLKEKAQGTSVILVSADLEELAEVVGEARAKRIIEYFKPLDNNTETSENESTEDI